MTELNLRGKVALVTGSTRGIGRAIAFRLLESGTSVFLNGRDRKQVEAAVKEWKENGFSVAGFTGDVSEEKYAKAFVNAVIEKFGRIDIAVNNAGVGELRFLEDITTKIWDEHLAVNLRAAFLVCREVAPFMKQQKSGRIVNIASTTGLTGRIGGAHYAASKSGLIGLTKALAKELGPHNIQVNAVAPGMTDTDMLRATYALDVVDNIAQRTPLGRIAQPDDIAKAVLFLASSLSDFVTGQVLVVDGGLLM